MRRIGTFAVAVVLGITAIVPAAFAGTTKLKVKVLASGLNSPKHLVFAHNGVYVAESGIGGEVGPNNCVTGPMTEGPGTTQFCAGDSGAISFITPKRKRPALAKLPSSIEVATGEASGPAAVSVSKRGKLAVVFQDLLVQQDGTNGLAEPAKKGLGVLALPGGVTVDLAAFAAAHPQDPKTFGGTMGETPYDSDPYDVIAYKQGYLVTDAAANSLLYVSRKGHVKLVARFPTKAESVPAGVLGPEPLTVDAQAVPTSLAIGPDGAIYVGTLRGVPSQPGTADIFRVVPGHSPKVWAEGLTAVTAIAFDARGRLLATEYNTGGLLSPPTVPGALVRVSANGKHVSTLPVKGLFQPTGVAVAPDGTVYVANHGVSSAASKPSGEVLAIDGLGTGAHGVRSHGSHGVRSHGSKGKRTHGAAGMHASNGKH